MSKNNNTISNLSIDNSKNITSHINENLKSKYVLANTIKANKISSKLSKTINNVVSEKNFIGYDENDYENVEKLCDMDNVNLFVKNKSIFSDDVNCKKILSAKQNFIGYSDTKFNSLNNNVSLNVKGNTEINGDLSITKNLNIGFDKQLINDNLFNVNGNSEIYGSQHINKNLSLNNDLILNNSLSLNEEIIDNITIINNIISVSDYNFLLNNILSSVKNHNQQELSTIKFNSKNNFNLSSSLISVSKYFILSNNSKSINTFILIYAIYSNSKIISTKPLLDTFTLIDFEENIIDKDKNKNKKNLKKSNSDINKQNKDFNMETFEIIK